MDADEMAASAWDRYFLGPPPEARATRFTDQTPGRTYDEIIAAHQSPPRLDETLAGNPELPEVTARDNVAPDTAAAWPMPQAIEQYVNTIVTNRLAGMQLSPANAAIAEDQLRAARRKQILGMTT